MLEAVLDGLDLHGHGREHRLLQPVELIEAAPRSALHQAHEDATHGLHVDALVDRRTDGQIFFTLISLGCPLRFETLCRGRPTPGKILLEYKMIE